MNKNDTEFIIKNEKYMNNIKLKKFILANKEFWNLISDDLKNLISKLETFGNLECYSNIEYTYEELKEDWSIVYLYIGKNKNFYYYYKCKKTVDSNSNIILKISEGELIIIRENKKIKYIYE